MKKEDRIRRKIESIEEQSDTIYDNVIKKNSKELFDLAGTYEELSELYDQIGESDESEFWYNRYADLTSIID